LSQSVADILFGQPAAAAQAFDDGGKSGGELVEQDRPRRGVAARALARERGL
jgi:hypothetical protein